MVDLNKTVIDGEEGGTWGSVRGSLNSVIAFVATLLIAWILYRLLQVAKAIAEVFIFSWYINALVNVIPHYPPPGLTRAFDQRIDERPFSQGGAFDTAPFDVCWLKSGW